MSEGQPSLLQLSRAGFDAAKKAYARKGLCRLLLFVVGIVALVVEGLPAYALSLAALGLESLAWWLGHTASELQELSEEAKRRSMLSDALGETSEPRDILTLRAKFSSSLTRDASFRKLTGYYGSKAPAGLAKLKDHMEEATFWSAHLYAKAASNAMWRFLAVVALVVVAAFLALPVASERSGLLLARVLVVVLGAVVAGDLLGRSLRWRGAARRCRGLLKQLETVDLDDREQCLAIFSDYAVATAAVAPIPTRLYEGEQNRLNELWHAHTSQ